MDISNSIDEDNTLDKKIEMKEDEKGLLFEEIKKKELTGNIKPEDKIMVLQNCYFYFKSGIPQTFYKKSKFITFSNEEVKNKFNKKYFIHNQDSLNKALKEANITDAIMTNQDSITKNYDSNDSKNSNISSESSKNLMIEDILEKSIDIIKQDKAIKLSKILCEQNYNQRFIINKLNELDFNFTKYKDFLLNNDSNIDFQKSNYAWLNEIYNFYKKKGTNFELIIMGPRGIGKTFNILTFLYIYKLPRLYFPIKEMIKYGNRKWKKIALYESLYIFDSLEEMNEFKAYCNNIPSDKDLFHFIYLYIDFIYKFYEKRKLRNKILIVLDDYYDSLDFFNTIIKITDLVYENNHKMLLCITGNCPYVYKKYYNYNVNQNQKYYITIWDLPFKEEKDILKLPLYNYRYNNSTEDEKANFEKKIKNEIIKEFKKIELNDFFSLSKYLNIFTNIKDLSKDFIHFPFEYLNLEKDENNKNLIKISFKLYLYKEVFLEYIKGLLKIDNIKSTFNLDTNDENENQKDGIQFEDIIVEQIWNNTLGLYEFPEKNKIRIKDIFSIKSYEGKTYKIEKDKNVIIRQSQFNGRYYDLLLIINIGKKRYAIFIQIGLSKKGFEIVKYFNNLSKFYIDYKKGIKKLIGVNINQIGFLLIFEYGKQIILKNENSKSQGTEFCKENNITYLIYKDFKLYPDLDSQNSITSINSININNTLILDEIGTPAIDIFKNNYIDMCEKMISEKYEPYISLDKDEKNKIIECINKKYTAKFNNLQFITNMGKKVEGFLDFGFFCNEFEQINIIETDNDKFMEYKKNIWKINNCKLVKIKDSEINKIKGEAKEYDLYLLDKKRNRTEIE